MERLARLWFGPLRCGHCGRQIAAIARLPEMAPSPLPRSTADVGAILLRKQTFLRSSVDRAIASLTADGTIAGFLKVEHFPGTPVP